MANKYLCIFVLIATIVGQAVAEDGVKTYTVEGWGQKVDYTGWLKEKEFYNGDRLAFKYPPGKHNVILVNEDQYNKCIIPPGDDEPGNGEDIIELGAGQVWLISGVGDDCAARNVKMHVPNVKCGLLRPKALYATRKLKT